MVAAGQHYNTPLAQRELPEVTSQPDWRDVLRRAFLANGDLEAAYFEWQAAMSRIRIASAWPNTNIQVGFDYMFSAGNMKAWDRTTISAAFDPQMMLQFPTKTAQAGKVALAEAQAKGLRFESAKFALQQKVLFAWWDYVLAGEKLRIQDENVRLLKIVADAADQRVRGGGPQQDLLKAQTAYELAANELANLRSELSAMRAMLNAMLARSPNAPLDIPSQLPPPRVIAADDAKLLAVAVDRNPELAALARDVQGRSDALELARLAYIPDLAPQVSINGSISQAIGLMVNLPTALPKIDGAISEARSMLRASEATSRQGRADRAGSFVAALYILRNSERQAALFEKAILPKARQVLDSTRQAYIGGTVTFTELIDSQRMLLEVRVALAEARASREKRLVELETLAGVDIETLSVPAFRPPGATTRPTSTPEGGG